MCVENISCVVIFVVFDDYEKIFSNKNFPKLQLCSDSNKIFRCLMTTKKFLATKIFQITVMFRQQQNILVFDDYEKIFNNENFLELRLCSDSNKIFW